MAYRREISGENSLDGDVRSVMKVWTTGMTGHECTLGFSLRLSQLVLTVFDLLLRCWALGIVS